MNVICLKKFENILLYFYSALRSFPGLEKKGGGGIQNVLFIHKSINEMSTHHRFRDAFFNYMATFLFRAIFFQMNLKNHCVLKNIYTTNAKIVLE